MEPATLTCADEAVRGAGVLFPGFTPDVIRRQYFNKESLLVPRAILDPKALLDFERFYGALANAEMVRAIFNSMHRASIAPNDAQEMFDAGATICVTGIDLAVPAISQVVKEMQECLGYLGVVSANAYGSPPGAGLSKHYDPRVVTVVQLSGTKKWIYSRAPFERNPLQVAYTDENREGVLTAHNDAVGTTAVELTPGDVLCLPAGIVHEASAGEASLSLNVAFDYIGHGVADRICQFIRRELLLSAELREPEFAISSPEQERRRLDAIERAISALAGLRGDVDQNYDVPR
jgi:ribosomal protein L16 Arg81 hydroxylase